MILEAFVATLFGKTAGAASSVAEMARMLGAKPRYGVGALAGGALGALAGAGTTPRGEEPGLNRRAAVGAAIGALGGAGAAKGLHWLGAGPVSGAERAARALHAQYYGLTGRLPGQGAMSPSEMAARLEKLDIGPRAAQAALTAAKPGTNLGPLRARLEAARTGIDTLPGVLKGLATRPLDTVRTAWQAQTPLGKAVTLGSGVFPIRELRKGKTEYGPTKEYSSRRQHALSEIGKNLGYVAAGAAPVAPLITAGTLLGEAGKTIGSLVG
jgi:hypothetical protein